MPRWSGAEDGGLSGEGGFRSSAENSRLGIYWIVEATMSVLPEALLVGRAQVVLMCPVVARWV